jgi:hypothetical protein
VNIQEGVLCVAEAKLGGDPSKAVVITGGADFQVCDTQSCI